MRYRCDNPKCGFESTRDEDYIHVDGDVPRCLKCETGRWRKVVEIDYKEDRIQFARLIDEMMAALDGSVVTKMINDMAESMDLSVGEINKLMDYAVHVWECAKVDALRGLRKGQS